jgi:hypothetical protein
MSYYECYRCKYRSKRNSDMKRHLNRKVKCSKNIEAYNYSDEELMNMSMVLHYDEMYVDDYIQIYENNNLEEDLQKNICTYCSKVFSRPDNVKRHQKNFCKKMILNSECNYNKKTNGNIINNITNIDNHTNNQTNNIIIINANNNTLKPFDGDWTIEHIDSYLRQIILLSETKYTDLLDEILKNKENLNVIIEKDSNSGLVYKNENELYVNMKVKEIIDISMQKLYDQLNSLYSNVLSNQISYKINTNLIENEKKILDNKFEDFCNNDDTKNIVSSLFTNIYEKNKIAAVEMSDKILSNKKIGY